MPDPTNHRIPWPRILAEGLVIVASILLALAADAWWSGVQARREAYQGLEGVLGELVDARATITRVGEYHELQSRNTAALGTHLRLVSPDQTIAVPDTMLTGVLFPVGVTEVPAVLVEAFASAGRLDEIQNEELRRQFLRWPTILQDLNSDEMLTREFVSGQLSVFLMNEADLWIARQTIDEFLFGIPQQDADLDHHTDLRSTTSLRNLVNQATGMYGNLSQQSRRLVAATDSLTSIIRQELQYTSRR